MSFRPFAALLLGLLLNLPALANEQEPARIEWRLEANQAAIDEALEKASAHAPYHSTEQLLLRRVFDVQSEQVVTHVRRIWRLPSASAVQSFGADSIYFDANRDTIRIDLAASIAPDGTAHWLRRSDAQVGLDDTPAVYTDMRRIDLWYPGLEAGSLAIVDYTVRSELKGAESIWSSRQFLQHLYPRRQLELVGQWGEALEARWTDDLEDLECAPRSDGFHCIGLDLAAVEYQEGILWRDVIPEFVISLAPSWDAVVELAGQRFQEALAEPGTIDTTVSALLESAETSEEQISRLHEFAARGIRYVSVSRHGNRITPKSVAKTLESRFGDCKDKSALLIAMLAEVGIKAHPVLVATDRTLLAAPELADMHYFDHMVVCLDEQQRCLDPTDAHTGTSVTPPWIQGKVSLALKPGAAPATIPVNEFRWALDINATLRFDANGDQTEIVTRRYQGEYAGLIRAQLQSLSESDRTDWAKRQYQEWASSSVEPSFSFAGVDELADALIIQSEVSYPELVSYSSPLSYNESSPWLSGEIQSMLLTSNSAHLSTFAGLRVTAKHTFDLPPQWQIAFAGPELAFDNEYGRYHSSSQRNGHQVVYESELELPYRANINTEEATRINKTLNRLSEQSTMHFIAKQSDARK